MALAWMPMAWGAIAGELPSGDAATYDSRLKLLAESIEKSLAQLRDGGTYAFHKGQYVQEWRGKVHDFRTDLAKFPPKGDAAVDAVSGMLLQLETLVSYGITEAAKRSADLDSIHDMLEDTRHNLEINPPPAPLLAPFDELAAGNWMVRVNLAKRTAEATHIALEKLETLVATTNQDAMMHQHHAQYSDELADLQNTANSYLHDAEKALEQTFAELNAAYARQEQDLTELRSIVYSNDVDHRIYYNAEDHGYPLFREFDRQLAIAESFVAYQRVFGKAPSVGSLERIAEFRHLRRQYAQVRRNRLGVAFPQITAVDGDIRMAIARRILSDPANGFADYGPIDLKTELQTVPQSIDDRAFGNDAAKATQSIGQPSAQVSTNSNWRDNRITSKFALATPARREDGEWRIWWITLQNQSNSDTSADRDTIDAADTLAIGGNWYIGEATDCGPIEEQAWNAPVSAN